MAQPTKQHGALGAALKSAPPQAWPAIARAMNGHVHAAPLSREQRIAELRAIGASVSRGRTIRPSGPVSAERLAELCEAGKAASNGK